MGPGPEPFTIGGRRRPTRIRSTASATVPVTVKARVVSVRSNRRTTNGDSAARTREPPARRWSWRAVRRACSSDESAKSTAAKSTTVAAASWGGSARCPARASVSSVSNSPTTRTMRTSCRSSSTVVVTSICIGAILTGTRSRCGTKSPGSPRGRVRGTRRGALVRGLPLLGARVVLAECGTPEQGRGAGDLQHAPQDRPGGILQEPVRRTRVRRFAVRDERTPARRTRARVTRPQAQAT